MNLKSNNISTIPFYLILFESIVNIDVALIDYLFLSLYKILDWRNLLMLFIGISILSVSVFGFLALAKIERRKWIIGMLVYAAMAFLSYQINFASSILMSDVFNQNNSSDNMLNILSVSTSLIRPLFIVLLMLIIGVRYIKEKTSVR
jgi:hypothetical protein